MKDVLTLLALLGLGGVLGLSAQRANLRFTRKRVLQFTGIVLGAPVILFVIALGLQSDPLAFLAGLSLMALLAVLAPVGLGALLGAYLARPRGGSSASLASAQPPAASPPPVKHARAASQGPVLSAQQRGLLIGAAGFGAGVWVALTLAFRFNEDYVPPELERGLVPAVLVLIASLSFGLLAFRQERPAFAPTSNAMWWPNTECSLR